MLCTECKKNNATVFYTQTINGNKTELALCKECASNFGMPSTTSLFSDLFSLPFTLDSTPKTLKKCSLCASTERDFIKDGKVSCPECYNTFKDELERAIKRIHGNVTHIGRAPSKYKKQNDKRNKLESLRKKLEELIKNEEYENAAKVRDQIRAIEAEG